jgi:hypothetical protein
MTFIGKTATRRKLISNLTRRVIVHPIVFTGVLSTITAISDSKDHVKSKTGKETREI